MKDFKYSAADSVEQAVLLLSAAGEARVLAGGTDLIVQLREGMRDADVIVDVKKIPELTHVEWTSERGLRFGAAVPCARLYHDDAISAAYAGLMDAARIIGGWQIQNRASIGGNLCNSSPAADSIPALMVYQATCHIAGASGVRTISVDQFCKGPGKNCLARGEFLVSIELPPQPRHSGSHYLRFIPRNEMDIAVVGAGAWLELDSRQDIKTARVALAAVAPTPLLASEVSSWLAGKPATNDTFQQAGEMAKKIARPISDRRGPAEYRLHLVGVLCQRALEMARERALANA